MVEGEAGDYIPVACCPLNVNFMAKIINKKFNKYMTVRLQFPITKKCFMFCYK